MTKEYARCSLAGKAGMFRPLRGGLAVPELPELFYAAET
jgi:hypothetical protein